MWFKYGIYITFNETVCNRISRDVHVALYNYNKIVEYRITIARGRNHSCVTDCTFRVGHTPATVT